MVAGDRSCTARRVYAGWPSAVLYSVLGTCKLHGINEWSYLTWALPRLAAATNHTAHEFTPQRFAALGT